MAQDDPVLATSFLRSAIAACIAETLTIPFDTAKVRLQLQLRSAAGNAPPHYKGPIGTLRTIVREEGILAPFKVRDGLHTRRRLCSRRQRVVGTNFERREAYASTVDIGLCPRTNAP